MKLLHKSETTEIYLNDNKIIKHFFGEDADFRFEKELRFYKTHRSVNLLKLYDFDSKWKSLTLEYVKGESPGFLDKLEAKNLTEEDLKRIKEAISNIQNIVPKKILVHNDLAPHNIYLTENRVIIADWDSYFLTEDEKYRNYDWEYLNKQVKI